MRLKLLAALYRLRNGLITSFQSRRLENEMEIEMAHHLENSKKQYEREGITAEAAKKAALRGFGNVEALKEECRDNWGMRVLNDLIRDVRYACRSLWKSPSFTVTAVLTLGLGIGVNSAIFGLYNTIALQPLPVKDPDGLVRIHGVSSEGKSGKWFSYARYLDYRDNNRTLEGLLAYHNTTLPLKAVAGADFNSTFYGNDAGFVPVEFVSDNYFSQLGGPIQIGRGLQPEDFKLGSPPVIVISDQFWERHFNRDPAMLGNTLTFESYEDKAGVTIQGRLVTVVGVSGARFLGQSPMAPAGWMPMTSSGQGHVDLGLRGKEPFQLIGRIKAGVTEEQVKAELDVISARGAIEFSSENPISSVRLIRVLRWANIPLTPENVARLSPIILGFGMVLLIACTNVVNLLLARSVARQSELGVRLTLGAKRGRIIRQLLTENVLICLLGATVGLVLGAWTLKYIITILLTPVMPEAMVESFNTMPDFRVLGYTFLLTLVAALVVGLIPALHSVRGNLIATMHNQSSEFGVGLSPSRLRKLMVIVQVAVCLAVLSCAGVFVRNAMNPERFAEGYGAEVIYSVSLAPNSTISDNNLAFSRALKTLELTPGVAGCAAMFPSPFTSIPPRSSEIRTFEASTPDIASEVQTIFVTSGFFDTFTVSFLRGRNFNDLEHHSSSRAIIISKSLANHLWPKQEAIGKKLSVSELPWTWTKSNHPSADGLFRECEVVGVVNDVKLNLGEHYNRVLYLPFQLDNFKARSVFVRPLNDSYKAQTEIVETVKLGGVGLRFINPLSAGFEIYETIFHSWTILSVSLGALALAIASVGLYGLLTFALGQRRREIGVRMAIGGTAEKITGLFVGQGMRLVAVGLVFGLIGGGLFALLIEKIFFGLFEMFDPMAYIVVTLLFSIIALVACWLPARAATKANPMEALRTE